MESPQNSLLCEIERPNFFPKNAHFSELQKVSITPIIEIKMFLEPMDLSFSTVDKITNLNFNPKILKIDFDIVGQNMVISFSLFYSCIISSKFTN